MVFFALYSKSSLFFFNKRLDAKCSMAVFVPYIEVDPQLSLFMPTNIFTKRLQLWFKCVFDFQFWFLISSWEELLFFDLFQNIWCLWSALSCLKIILSNQRCVLLLRAGLIYAQHVEQAETENCKWKNDSNIQRPWDLKNIWGQYLDTKLTIIYLLTMVFIYFFAM